MNTLTRLIPDLYAALDTVSRELVGFIPSVSRDSTAERAAVGEDVVSFETPEATASDVIASQLPPDDGDQVIGNRIITIQKSRRVPFRWNGEQSKGVNNGPGARAIQNDQLTQAIRVLCNEMEADIGQLYGQTSRAYGTAGTTPFATDLSDTAEVRKILADNGSPMGNLQMVIDTTAGAKMRTLTNLTHANEANDATLLRQGVLLDVHGFAIRESAQVANSVAGTASGATSDTTGYAAGATVITLAAAGTGTINAGDKITFAGDTNVYVVEVGNADVSAAGDITLAAPGLIQALAASAVAITVAGNAVNNMAFDKSALYLATRAPALPDGGDMAVDRTVVTDPRSGLSFEVSMYAGYRQMQYEVSAAWGVANMKPAHSAILLG